MSNLLTSVLFRKRNQQRNAKSLQIHNPNGIAESKFIRIGGIDQWISIRGEDRKNPVLFIVHGGPASSYSIFHALQRSWEKYFTVVQWDQPGAGNTFTRNGEEGTGKITFDRLIQDGIEVAEYLQKELGQQKVILVGSSVGSLTGIQMAHLRPDLFHAYVGTDQNAPDPDQLGYQAILDALTKAGDKKGLAFIKKMGPNPMNWTKKDSDKRVQILIKAVKNVPNMIMDLILPAMLSSSMHTFGDIKDYFKGMGYSSKALTQELIHFYPDREVTALEIPLFIFQGDSDVVTPTVTARAYFDKIKAPHKEFALIRQAGHLACFARPEQFLTELITHVLPQVKKERKNNIAQ
jgi:pimeloyl-ACP methyl ester carboxylesterase